MTADVLAACCYGIAGAAAIGLVLLRHPNTFLSRLVDPVDENPTREVTR